MKVSTSSLSSSSVNMMPSCDASSSRSRNASLLFLPVEVNGRNLIYTKLYMHLCEDLNSVSELTSQTNYKNKDIMIQCRLGGRYQQNYFYPEDRGNMLFHDVYIQLPDLQTRRKHLPWCKYYVTVFAYSEQKFQYWKNFQVCLSFLCSAYYYQRQPWYVIFWKLS